MLITLWDMAILMTNVVDCYVTTVDSKMPITSLLNEVQTCNCHHCIMLGASALSDGFLKKSVKLCTSVELRENRCLFSHENCFPCKQHGSLEFISVMGTAEGL